MIISSLMVVGGYRIGRFVTHLECIQLRITNRELLQMQAESRRQIDAVDDALSTIFNDPRTYENTKLQIERAREHVKRRQT